MPETTERIRVNLSYFLKDKPRLDHTHQLKARIRVYNFGRLTNTFALFIKDGKESIFLKKGELIKGQISSEHPKSIRLNELLKAVENEVDTIIKNELHTTTLKVENVRQRLDMFLQRFNSDYLEFLKREIITLTDKDFPLSNSNSIQVDKSVLDKFSSTGFIDDETGLPVDAESLEDILKGEQADYESNLRATKIKSLSTERIYQQGLWDKKNIFQMFGSLYYDSKVPATYHKIVIRLFEYREHRKPTEDVEKFNVQWLIDFFKFLKEKGKYTINTVNFDPLNYDPERFFLDKQREPYEPKSLNKMIGIAKTVTVGTQSEFSFYKLGYIPKIDLSNLRLSAITDDKDKDGTRIEHNLTKEELDQLYWFPFNKKDLSTYQEIFNKVNRSKGVFITTEDLETARALFILQVSFGGLRGYKELTTAKILKHSNSLYKVTFFQNKVTQTVTNPLNQYSEGVLKPLSYKMPVLTRTNARTNGKAASVKMLEGHYRALLQTIGHIINFDREVLTDDVKFIHEPVKELFNPYFSRKTFGTLLYGLKVAESDIELFTGHRPRNASELSSSYIQKNTIENKLGIIKVLKIGKNPYR